MNRATSRQVCLDGHWKVGVLSGIRSQGLYAECLSPSHPIPLLLLWGLRVRLSEGFHFACSGEGIITMVLELPIQVRAIPHIPPRSIVISGLLTSERVRR